jgi:amino acid transporter
MSIAATLSFVATASRMTFAFARDRGMPGWRWLGHVRAISPLRNEANPPQVEKHWTLPLWAIALTATISILLSLINLGSDVAFNDVVSLAVCGLYSSYLIGNSLLLFRRLRGDIRPYTSDSDILTNTTGAAQLSWGPWRIREPWGAIVNIFGVAYMVVVLFFIFWPTMYAPSPDKMNFSVVMGAAVIVLALVYWLVRARRVYVGPVIEVNIGR